VNTNKQTNKQTKEEKSIRSDHNNRRVHVLRVVFFKQGTHSHCRLTLGRWAPPVLALTFFFSPLWHFLFDFVKLHKREWVAPETKVFRIRPNHRRIGEKEEENTCTSSVTIELWYHPRYCEKWLVITKTVNFQTWSQWGNMVLGRIRC